MDKAIGEVKKFYDENAQAEWERLERHPFEFELTSYMLDKHINSGDSVLDIGGGPGRYSIYLAARGCDVTLIDLSDGNISLALEKAKEAGVEFKAYAKNCLDIDSLPLAQYDHVLLMGPLYHIKDDAQRREAVEKALARLKPGGLIYASFIMPFAGIIYDLKTGGNIERDLSNPETGKMIDVLIERKDYIGPAFTTARFCHPSGIPPFMESFGLEKVSFFGQEGILAPNEYELLAREPSERAVWLDTAKRLIELPELMCYSEHAMFIGRKPNQ